MMLNNTSWWVDLLRGLVNIEGWWGRGVVLNLNRPVALEVVGTCVEAVRRFFRVGCHGGGWYDGGVVLS